MEEGRYIARLRERLAADPGSRLFLSLAEELRRRGRDEEALSLMREGTGRDPSFLQARMRLAGWHLEAVRYDEAGAELAAAAESCDRMLEERPGDETLRQGREALSSLLRRVETAKGLESLLEGINARFGGR